MIACRVPWLLWHRSEEDRGVKKKKKKKKICWRWSLARNVIAPYWWPLLLFVSSFSLCFRVKTPTETRAYTLHLSKPHWLSFIHHTLQYKLSCPFAYRVVMYLHETSAVLCGSSGIITETQTLTSFYCENRHSFCMFVTVVSVFRVQEAPLWS